MSIPGCGTGLATSKERRGGRSQGSLAHPTPSPDSIGPRRRVRRRLEALHAFLGSGTPILHRQTSSSSGMRTKEALVHAGASPFSRTIPGRHRLVLALLGTPLIGLWQPRPASDERSRGGCQCAGSSFSGDVPWRIARGRGGTPRATRFRPSFRTTLKPPTLWDDNGQGRSREPETSGTCRSRAAGPRPDRCISLTARQI